MDPRDSPIKTLGNSTSISRRKWLRQSLIASLLATSPLRRRFELFASAPSAATERFLGVVPFSGEGNPPMGLLIGSELDGRLFTDLSNIKPENRITPNERFFVRTSASRLLNPQGWTIQLGGAVDNPAAMSIGDLVKQSRAMGTHLMECSGNTRMAHFGLLSSAEWDGVPLTEILDAAKPSVPSARVMVSGFDRYEEESMTSVPGASWIFSREQISSSNAFFATRMNGQPLNSEHGAPVRLVVPGWYGCACIKWVNRIEFVADEVPATSQMQEYAGRTLQSGVPELAREYQPAAMCATAMPVRIEKWIINGRIRYRVSGIRWGTRSNPKIEIRFDPAKPFSRLENIGSPADGGWAFWSYDWAPDRTGAITIRMRLTGVNLDTRKLNSGYYDRSAEINEI